MKTKGPDDREDDQRTIKPSAVTLKVWVSPILQHEALMRGGHGLRTNLRLTF